MEVLTQPQPGSILAAAAQLLPHSLHVPTGFAFLSSARDQTRCKIFIKEIYFERSDFSSIIHAAFRNSFTPAFLQRCQTHRDPQTTGWGRTGSTETSGGGHLPCAPPLGSGCSVRLALFAAPPRHALQGVGTPAPSPSGRQTPAEDKVWVNRLEAVRALKEGTQRVVRPRKPGQGTASAPVPRGVPGHRAAGIWLTWHQGQAGAGQALGPAGAASGGWGRTLSHLGLSVHCTRQRAACTPCI